MYSPLFYLSYLSIPVPQIEIHEAIVHCYENSINPSLTRERKAVTMPRQKLRKTPSEPRKKIFSQLETSHTFSGTPHTDDTNRLDVPIHEDTDADSLIQLVTQSELKEDTTPGDHHYHGNLWPDVHTIRTRGHGSTSDIVYHSTDASVTESKPVWPDVHTIRTRGRDTSDIVYHSTDVSVTESKPIWPDVHTIITRGRDTSDIVNHSTNVSKSASKAENVFLGRCDQEKRDSGETGVFLSTQPWETIDFSVSKVFSEENIKL